MQTLYLSFSVVFPLMCLMALGYSISLLKMHSHDFFNQVSALSFEIFLPALLFINIYRTDFDYTRSLSLVAFAITTILVFFALLLFVVPKLVPKAKNCSAIIQGSFRANLAVFGISIVSSLYGSEALADLSILIAFIIPLFNVISIVALQFYSEKKSNLLSNVKTMCKNPLILASLLGFVCSGFNIHLPMVIEKTISDLASVVTPLALLALGGTFKFREIKQYTKELSIAVVAKLLLLPALFIPLAVLLGFEKIEILALLAMYASPTAVSSHPMAQSMGANADLAGEIVVLTSVFSIFSIFFLVALLQHMNLI